MPGVIEMMQGQVDGGEDFRRNFVMLVVSTYLHGRQRGEVNYLIMNALVDLSKLRRLNYTQYTMRALVLSVDE